jgi:hypothetical protein
MKPRRSLPVRQRRLVLALDSLIVLSFPPLFDEFRGKHFVLLWRGSRGGFGGADFCRRCNAKTLTLISDTGGNVFGGFTPLPWELSKNVNVVTYWKRDDSLKSFLFRLKNSHNTSARRFALKRKKQSVVFCSSLQDPGLGSVTLLFTITATQRPIIPLTLTMRTPATLDWTGHCLHRFKESHCERNRSFRDNRQNNSSKQLIRSISDSARIG